MTGTPSKGLLLGVALLSLTAAAAGEDALADGFRSPPPAARPHTWWHWMNGNVSKAGITADLEAMARVGLGGVQVFDAGLAIPEGPVAFDTPAWYDHLVFAAKEAARLGLSFGIANCSGWTSSGGPWITPELSMKVVTNTALRVTGPQRLETKLALPAKTNGFYADIAVLAFPTPAENVTVNDLDHQVLRLRGEEFRLTAIDEIPGSEILEDSCVDPAALVNLTAALAADGTLRWTVPAGAWTILRIGYMANGQRNRPPSRNGGGLECDKLSAKALDVHFDAYVAKFAALAKGVASFDNVLLDSYEVKGQNWTQGLENEFRRRAGYDLTPFLPVFAGYPVDTPAATRKFLRDFRRVLSDLFCQNYAGRLAARCHEIGVSLACEPYGNGPFNDLAFAAEADIPMSEFWTARGDGAQMWARWGHKHRGNTRTVASSGHFWGKPVIGAEAFTAYPTPASGRWLEHPGSMKAQGDRQLADGANRFYFHRYVHQPWTNPTRYPGMTMAFYGSHLERTQTWWENGMKAYVGYLTRAQYLLQRGTFVADVLIDNGDEAPNFCTAGEVPRGWRADHCTSRARAKLRREGDAFVSPGGVRYRVVAKPDENIKERLQAVGCAPDFICADRNVSWIHRRDGDDEIYFVATASDLATRVVCSFRDAAGEPELWNPETGEITRTTCRRLDGRAEMELALGPVDSTFVVFRKRPTPTARAERAPAQTIETVSLEGPWNVTFCAPGAKETFSAEFATLADWAKSANDDIRYFSGTATYEKKVDGLKAEESKTRERVLLDLGDVREIAEVTVNGKSFRTLWKPPYVLDITEAVGQSAQSDDRTTLFSIRVTNRWPNRLIGDERLHADKEKWTAENRWRRPVIARLPDWLRRDAANPSGASTFVTCRLWKGEDEPLPSGLLGPVRILRQR